VELGLDVYHVFEPAVKQLIAPDRYDELIETLELGLEADAIVAAVGEARAGEGR
jgi:hypothetical protein